MSHKVHPKSFRIRNNADWDSRGFYGKKLGPGLQDDFIIRQFLKKKIGKLGVEKIEIERFPGKTIIIISSARPGLIIGRGGQGLEDLKKKIEKEILKKSAKVMSFVSKKTKSSVPPEIKIEIREVKNIWASAPLVAQWVVSQIEKRVRFRRVLKQVLDKVISAKTVQGIRVEVAGRLDGNEIARTEWLKKGRLPRQTIRADIDFIQDEAHCTYGSIGIKVWIYKGDKFD